MSAPTEHTTPDGSTFRISMIQAVRDQSLFNGQTFTFQVDPEEAAESAAAFQVKVVYAPIALAIASPQDRLQSDNYAADLVETALDRGCRQDAVVHVTSDGAAKLGDEVIERLFAISV